MSAHRLKLLLAALLFSSLVPAAAAQSPVEVEIKSLDVKGGRITIIYKGQERVLRLAAKVDVVVDGSESDVDKLLPGDRAAVVFDKVAAVITSIAARRKGPIALPADDPAALAMLRRMGVHTNGDAAGNVVEVNFAMMKDRAQLTDARLAKINWKGLPHVEIVKLQFTPVTDAGLRRLKLIRGLKELDLTMTQVTDAGIQSLQGFPALESLQYGSYVVKKLTDQSIGHVTRLERLTKLKVGMFPISDVELAGLAKLTNLKSLRISACRISDQGLSFLPALKELRSLDLSRNGEKLTNKGLDHVTRLVALEELELADNRQINDAGMEKIGILKNLRKLNVNGTLITDAGLIHLKNMPHLQELQMGGTRVSDAGLVHLQDLGELRMLNVSGTRITDAGLATLKPLRQLNRIIK